MQIEESMINSKDKKIQKIALEYINSRNQFIIKIFSKSKVCYFYDEKIDLEPRLFNFLLELAKNTGYPVEHHVLDGRDKIEKNNYKLEDDYKLYKADQQKRVRNSKYELLKILKTIIEYKIKKHEENHKKLFGNIKHDGISPRAKRAIKKVFAVGDFVFQSPELYKKSLVNPDQVIEGVSKKGFKLNLGEHEVLVAI